MKKYLLLLLVLFSVCLSAQKAPRNSRAFRPGASGTVKGTDASGNADDIVPEVHMYIAGKQHPINALVNRDGVIYRALVANASDPVVGTDWETIERSTKYYIIPDSEIADHDAPLTTEVSAWVTAQSYVVPLTVVFINDGTPEKPDFTFWVDENVTTQISSPFTVGNEGAFSVTDSDADNANTSVLLSNLFDLDGTSMELTNVSLGGITKLNYGVFAPYSTASTLSANSAGIALRNGNISGSGSVGSGRDITISGSHIFAAGRNLNISGSGYTASFGQNHTTTGGYMFSSGLGNSGNGTYAFVSGASNSALGGASITSGSSLVSNAGNQATFGRLNQVFASQDVAIGSTNQFDLQFVIGNGEGTSDRNNSLTHLKNGFTQFRSKTAITDNFGESDLTPENPFEVRTAGEPGGSQANIAAGGVLLAPMTATQRNNIPAAQLNDGIEIYCTDCTANNASVGVKQVYQLSTTSWINLF